MAEDCIFCRIIKGEIPCDKVYEDDKMLAMRDIAPAAPVHVLLLPKEHTDNITTADPELVAYMLGKVKMIAEKPVLPRRVSALLSTLVTKADRLLSICIFT